jgi:hypothetical protein
MTFNDKYFIFSTPKGYSLFANRFSSSLTKKKSVPIRFIRVIGVPISQAANRQQSFIFKSE